MVNRYSGKCAICGGLVPALGGSLKKRGCKWIVTHTSCDKAQEPQVTSFYFPSTGNTVYQNSHGRCEDAPCCGCCS